VVSYESVKGKEQKLRKGWPTRRTITMCNPTAGSISGFPRRKLRTNGACHGGELRSAMKTRANSSWLVTILLLGTALVFGASDNKTSFPGPKSESRSPDGRYSVKNMLAEHAQRAYLVLVDRKSGMQHKVRDYARHVEVLWSPASDAFVVNDFEGSDSTRPILYFVPWAGNNTDLLQKLTDFLRGRREEKLVIGNGHVYLTVARWVNDQEILCRLEAYGEASPHGSGFDGYYVYKIGDGFRVYNH
jgi:hypothetical protein